VLATKVCFLVLILLFLFVVLVIYFSEKKKRNGFFACDGTIHLWQRNCSKQIFWWNQVSAFYFLKGNNVLNKTSH